MVMSALMLNLKLKPQAYAPVTANGYLQDIKGVSAIIFQNVGTNNCTLWNGMYTVLANGGTLALNATEQMGTIDILQLMVQFTGAGTNRLEIVVLRPGNDNTPIPC